MTKKYNIILTIVYIIIILATIFSLINIYKSQQHIKNIESSLYKFRNNPITKYLNDNISIEVISKTPILIIFRNILKPDIHLQVLKEAKYQNSQSIRNKLFEKYRKGSAISSKQIIRKSNTITHLYFSEEILNLIRKTGIKVTNVPVTDMTSINILYYDKPSDHMYWHYDKNYFIGNRYSSLLCLENTNTVSGKKSCAELQILINNQIKDISLLANDMLLFNGSKIKHKVTKTCENDLRIVLTMTYCDRCYKNPLMYLYEKFINWSFYKK